VKGADIRNAQALKRSPHGLYLQMTWHKFRGTFYHTSACSFVEEHVWSQHPFPASTQLDEALHDSGSWSASSFFHTAKAGQRCTALNQPNACVKGDMFPNLASAGGYGYSGEALHEGSCSLVRKPAPPAVEWDPSEFVFTLSLDDVELSSCAGQGGGSTGEELDNESLFSDATWTTAGRFLACDSCLGNSSDPEDELNSECPEAACGSVGSLGDDLENQ